MGFADLRETVQGFSRPKNAFERHVNITSGFTEKKEVDFFILTDILRPAEATGG